jgi:predicted component of type VI protein secretion system
MQATLIVLDPPAAGRELKLSLPATIGRSREAQFKLVHSQVSRLHCEFFERDGVLYVRDLGSKNGTFVGDVQITEAPLQPGDTVTIGSVRVRASYDAAADAHFLPVAFAATDTIRKAAEATIRPQTASPGAVLPKSAPKKIEADPSESLTTTVEQPSAPLQSEVQEGSFDWFDDLTADQTEEPAAQSTPPLPPAQPDVAADDSLNILPPPADSSTDEPGPTATLQWRVPEPSSPVESDFAFHLEQSAEGVHKSKATQNPEASTEAAKNDDDDLDQFLKSLE